MPEWKKNNDTKLRKGKKKGNFGSKIDAEPKVHGFNADTGLQVLFDQNTATLSDFMNLFLTDKFFQLISGWKNLYTE